MAFHTHDFYKEPFYYENTNNIAEINSMAEWEYAFEPKKNWKQGRSAWELAHFMMEQDGLAKILDGVNLELSDLCDEDWDSWNNDTPKHLKVAKCIIEKSDPFDSYPSPRKHDLAIYGRVKNRKFKILVEAKVDEPFGPTIEDVYKASLDNPHSLLHNRIDNLLNEFSTTERQREMLSQCRYQLLHYLAAATNGKDYNGIYTNYDLIVMLVLVFKNNLYDTNKGIYNIIDYFKFMNLFGSCTFRCADMAYTVGTLDYFNSRDGMAKKIGLYNPNIIRSTDNIKKLFQKHPPTNICTRNMRMFKQNLDGRKLFSEYWIIDS